MKEDLKVESGAKDASPEDGLQKTVKVRHTIYFVNFAFALFLSFLMRISLMQ